MTNYYVTLRAQPSFTKQQYKPQIKEKQSCFLCNKSRIAVKSTIHQSRAVSKAKLRNFLNPWSSISVLNPESYCIPCRHRLLGQSIEQPLNNLSIKSLQNISKFENLGLTLVTYKNNKCRRQGKDHFKEDEWVPKSHTFLSKLIFTTKWKYFKNKKNQDLPVWIFGLVSFSWGFCCSIFAAATYSFF